MKAFVVNMDRSPDRMQTVHCALAEKAIAYERIPAVDGSTEDVSTEINHLVAFLGEGLTKPRLGQVGCYLSHRKVWQHVVSRGIEQCVVFEDDVNLADWDGRFLKIKLADLGLDLLQIGWNKAANSLTKKPLVPAPEKYLGYSIVREPVPGTCGYIITLSGAKKCLAAGKYWFPVDRVEIWNKLYALRSAALFPNICRPDDSPSTMPHKKSKRGPRAAFLRNVANHVLINWFRILGPPRA